MHFDSIIGQKHIISHLTTSADAGRIPHAQLFIGKEGSGVLPTAIAYARHILCNESSEACHLKFNQFSHPDLHFSFPVAINYKVKKHPVSNLFLDDWRTFLHENIYGSLYDWYEHIGIENKQGQIGVDEAQDIVKKLSLKSYEGGYKIMLIWMADKMNVAAANKLLKLIEEPPNGTLFILIAENEDAIINTIKSRCQVLHFPILTEENIKNALVDLSHLNNQEAISIAQQVNGNYRKALQLIHSSENDSEFEEWFITWVRAAFRAKGNKTVINDLISWSENLAKLGREKQKQFLHYCLNFFRQALMSHYQVENLVYLKTKTPGFDLNKFAPFIDGTNINTIAEAIAEALNHIERNGNAKIIFTDLSIQLTRLLHKK